MADAIAMIRRCARYGTVEEGWGGSAMPREAGEEDTVSLPEEPVGNGETLDDPLIVTP